MSFICNSLSFWIHMCIFVRKSICNRLVSVFIFVYLHFCLYFCLSSEHIDFFFFLHCYWYIFVFLSGDIVYPLYIIYSAPNCLLLYLFNTIQFVSNETITHKIWCDNWDSGACVLILCVYFFHLWCYNPAQLVAINFGFN